MVRYTATALLAALLLAIALKAREAAPESVVADEGPAPAEVLVNEGPAGHEVTVKHRLLGSVSRASLVYELDGQERTAARRTDCERSLQGGFRDDGYTTTVELTGTLPRGASQVRLVLEAETGTTVLPIELN